MSSEWTAFTELLTAIVDNRGKTCPVGEVGLPLIATNCIDGESLHPRYDTTRFVDESTYASWFRGHPLPGDILFVCKGSPGRTAVAPDPVDFCIAQDMVAVRADKRKVSPRYLFAALRSKLVQDQIANMHVGTMIPHFKKGDFGKLLIPRLDRLQEAAVGDLHYEICERIRILRETNATLEAIAQALFKSWFVEFDPVRAKRDGRAPEGMDEATAALFPDSFEDSKLGEVPSGWRICQLSDVAEAIFSGGTPDTRRPEYWHGGIPWFSSGETRNLVVTDTEKTITQAGVDGSSTRAARPGDVLIASAGQGHTRGQTSMCAIDCFINQSVVAVRADDAISAYWLFFNLRRRYDEMRNLSDSHSSRGSLTTKLLAAMPVVKPPEKVLRAFDGVATPLMDLLVANQRRVTTLSHLRDTLLPRLISGQLRLPEATVTLEEALA